MKLHLYRWRGNGLVFKIARTNIHENFLHRNMILSSIMTLLKNNLSNLYNAFIKESITAIENLSFEIYFRFSRIQTHRIFCFLRRLFAKHQTLTSKCWMSSSWSRSHKIRLYCCHSNIDFI